MIRSELQLVLSNHFELVPNRSTADELVIICPSCPPNNPDTTGNRAVNIKTLRTNCWRCGIGGQLVPWCRKVGVKLDLSADQLKSASVDELDSLLAELDRPPVKATGYVPSVPLPKGFTRLDTSPERSYHKLIGRMAVRKRLTLDAFKAAGAGYTEEDDRWEPFAIFPCYEWGRPVYYQGRTYVDTPGESTKLFPSRKECPLSSRYWVYNIDKLRGGGKIAILVEAVLSVLSLELELAKRGIKDAVPVGCYKHHLSDNQRTKILACNPKEVCVMFDGDSYDASVKTAISMVNATQASAIRLFDDDRRKDPNDDAAAAIDLFEARSPVDHLTALNA